MVVFCVIKDLQLSPEFKITYIRLVTRYYMNCKFVMMKPLLNFK